MNRKLRLAALVLAMTLGGLDLAVTALLVDRYNTERAERIHENCRLFEGRYRLDLEQLVSTRRYLVSLKRSERRTTLNRRIAAGVPTAVKRARADRPPAYCK